MLFEALVASHRSVLIERLRDGQRVKFHVEPALADRSVLGPFKTRLMTVDFVPGASGIEVRIRERTTRRWRVWGWRAAAFVVAMPLDLVSLFVAGWPFLVLETFRSIRRAEQGQEESESPSMLAMSARALAPLDRGSIDAPFRSALPSSE